MALDDDTSIFVLGQTFVFECVNLNGNPHEILNKNLQKNF